MAATGRDGRGGRGRGGSPPGGAAPPRRPPATRRVLERLGARPVLGGAAAAAGLSVVVAVATVPFGIAAHERSVDVGLSTQSLGGWAIDWVKGGAIAAFLAGLVGTVALALMRRFG